MTTGKSTHSVHGGNVRQKAHHSLTPPIVHTAPFTFENTADMSNFMFERTWGKGTNGREEYAREGNPTVQAVEARLAALEPGGEAALLFGTGMGAMCTVILAHLSAGDHVVLTDFCYRHTREFCLTFLGRFGVKATIVPVGDYAALEAAIQPGITKMIISESPTNPLLRLVDFEQLGRIGQKYDLITIVDSTFGSPLNQAPLAYGIDYVMHSATKYLGGHHDLLAGVIIGKQEKIAGLRPARILLGGIASPETAFLLERGLKTLAIRMARHNENGLAVARFLADHPKIAHTYYPGLEDHPDYLLAQAQMPGGYGGVVSFKVAGDAQAAACVVDALQIPYIGASLGGVDSLIGQPYLTTYYDFEPEEREAIGITDNLVRYALGIEDAADLIADLEQALARI